MRWLLFLLAPAAWTQTAASIDVQMRSVALQRDSVRRQTASWAAAPSREASAADCDPLTAPESAALVEGAAKAQQLPSKLVRAVIAQESGFRPCAESKKGAKGLMQLMPATAGQFDVAEPFDPEENVAAGTKYLRQLLERYKGDLTLALAAYNAGPATVDAAGGVPPIRETRDYVQAILGVMGITQIDLPNIRTPTPIEN